MGLYIRPVIENGVAFYPISIIDAIFDASNNKSLRTILGEMGITIDSALSSTSENPVQNKVINAALGNKSDKSATVSNVAYDSTNKKLTKTINGTTTDLITVAALKAAMELAKADVGLGNVTNDAQVKRTEMGAANGVATLDAEGKVPSSQLPSYVDDVIEGYLYNGKFYSDSAHTTEITGEGGKIYTDLSTNKTYRWSGTAFTVISDSLALGETAGTAYEGSKGKATTDKVNDTSSDDATLEWDTLKKIAKVNGLEIKVKLPANPNTDTKVTSVGNHYAPEADNAAELTATLNGTAGAYAKDTEYTVITGITLQRDAKGHVVGVKYTAQKVKDTNTTYTTMTQAIASAGAETTGKTISAKVLVDTINEKAVTAGTAGTTEYADVTSLIS